MNGLRGLARGAVLHSAAVAALVVTSPSLAQTQPPEDLAMARALGTEGVRLADAGDCAAAVPKLTAAEKLYHAPTTLERLGECEIKIGKLVSGTERLNRVLREPLPADAPPVFQAARKRAQDTLAPAVARIGKLRIHVDGVPADSVILTVDGASVVAAVLDAPMPIDPGAHTITVTAPGFQTSATTVTIADGGDSSASLSVVRQPEAPAPAAVVPPSPAPPATAAPPPPPVAPAPAAPSPPAPQGSSNVPAIVSFVAGGVGIAVGSIFGVLALSTHSTLNNECGPTKQTCSNPSDVSALATNAWVSNVGFGVGIVGAVVGTVFLLTNHGSQTVGSPSPRITPWIGVGSAGLGGSFQ
jgi:hypothetical protein